MNHLVSDSITRIKNALMARRKEVRLPYSRLVKEIGNVLVKEKYLKNIKEEVEEEKKVLIATVQYERRIPVITDIAILSKPSLRLYADKAEIVRRERRGRHTVVLSTSKGVMTGKEAQKQGVGGELLFEVW